MYNIKMAQKLVEIVIDDDELMARLPALPWSEDQWYEVVFQVGQMIHYNGEVIEDKNRLRDWFDSYRFWLSSKK